MKQELQYEKWKKNRLYVCMINHNNQTILLCFIFWIWFFKIFFSTNFHWPVLFSIDKPMVSFMATMRMVFTQTFSKNFLQQNVKLYNNFDEYQVYKQLSSSFLFIHLSWMLVWNNTWCFFPSLLFFVSWICNHFISQRI